MPLLLSGFVPRSSLLDDPNFWLRDLRLGRHAELVRYLGDDDYRAARIASLLPTRRALACVADCLQLPVDGTTADLRARLLSLGAEIAPYLAAADFARGKHPDAIGEVAAALPAAIRAGCLDRSRRPDPLLLVLHLAHAAPEALVHVRGLSAWNRRNSHSYVLMERVTPLQDGLLDFLTAERVEAAIAPVPRPAGVPPLRFEFAFSRPDGGMLLGLRRNLRRAHHWSDDGALIHHGHEEDLVLLHFLDDGRRLRLASRTQRFAQRLAEALVSAWAGRPCRYAEDILSAHPAALRRMVSALVGGMAPGLRLVGVDVRECPLEGNPNLSLRVSPRYPDLGPAIAHFEATTGPLLEQLDHIERVQLAFGERDVVVDFRGDGRAPLVQFGDGRLPRSDAAAFRALVARQFGLGEHPASMSA